MKQVDPFLADFNDFSCYLDSASCCRQIVNIETPQEQEGSQAAL